MNTHIHTYITMHGMRRQAHANNGMMRARYKSQYMLLYYSGTFASNMYVNWLHFPPMLCTLAKQASKQGARQG